MTSKAALLCFISTGLVTAFKLLYKDTVNSRDAPIIGSVIGNADYRLIFSYRLSDRYVYQISSRSDIICGQSQSIGN